MPARNLRSRSDRMSPLQLAFQPCECDPRFVRGRDAGDQMIDAIASELGKDRGRGRMTVASARRLFACPCPANMGGQSPTRFRGLSWVSHPGRLQVKGAIFASGSGFFGILNPLSCSLAGFSELPSSAAGGVSGGFFRAARSRFCSTGQISPSAHQQHAGLPSRSSSNAGHPGAPCTAMHRAH